MQASVPAVMDISQEPQHILDLYGANPGFVSPAGSSGIAVGHSTGERPLLRQAKIVAITRCLDQRLGLYSDWMHSARIYFNEVNVRNCQAFSG